MRHLALLLLLLFSFDLWADTHVLGDLEGSTARIDTLVSEGKLRWVDTPQGRRLQFTRPGDSLVFLGDLGGPNWQDEAHPRNIEIRDALLELKKANPQRVDLILGNHEYNRLGFVRDNIRTNLGQNGEYAEYLRSHNLQDSTLNRVKHWAGSFYNDRVNPLIDYQREMSNRLGRAVSEAEAAEQFARDLAPGPPRGRMLEYITLGQEMAVRDGFLFTHGPLGPSSLGTIPLGSTEGVTPQNWVGMRDQRFFRPQMDQFLRDVTNGRVPSNIFVEIGDASYDPTSKLLGNHPSTTTYTERPKGEQPRALYDDVAEYLDGYRGAVSGHKPAGNLVTVYRQETRAGRTFLDIAADTSRGTEGVHASLSIRPDGVLDLGGRTTDGTNVRFTVGAPDSDRLIGRVTADDFHIKGKTPDGRYILERYNGYNLEQRVVPRNQIGQTQLSTASPASDRLYLKKQAALRAAIEGNGGRILANTDEVSRVINGRFVLDFSGEASFGNLTPERVQELRAQLTRLADELDPRHVVILKRGNIVSSNATVENLVSQIFSREGHRFDIIGVTLSDTAPGMIDRNVRSVLLSPVAGNFDQAFAMSEDILLNNSGARVVIGGQGVVERSLQTPGARRLASEGRILLVDGFGGASGTASKGVAGQRVGLGAIVDRLRGLDVSVANRRAGVRVAGPGCLERALDGLLQGAPLP